MGIIHCNAVQPKITISNTRIAARDGLRMSLEDNLSGLVHRRVEHAT
jgi:hypothetical protein